MGKELGLQAGDSVLDVACGKGTSACFLAGAFGCRVTGVDLSEKNLEEARAKATGEGVQELVTCVKAAREKFRILKPGGRLGITDMAVDQDGLPEEMKSLLFHVACIAGGLTLSALLFLLPGTIWGWLGVAFLLTGIFGICPTYMLLKAVFGRFKTEDRPTNKEM